MPVDLLSDILTTLKLQGTLYFRTEFTSPWGVQVPAFENVARFHFVHRGRCYAQVDGVAGPVLLQQGDLIIITRGAAHILSDPLNTRVLAVDDVITRSNFAGEGALVYGQTGGDHETRLVCGHFAFDPDASHPLIDALPPFIHLQNDGGLALDWLKNSLAMIAAETGRGQMGGDLVALRLSEIILAQAIRSLINGVTGRNLVLAAFADPNIYRALQALHANPAAEWTVEELSRAAGLSRTIFAARFHDLMGITPLRYLTQWRMQLARRLLTETMAPIVEVAERSGYRSEAAFSRIFRKHFNEPPAGYRRKRIAIPATGAAR